jgi:hypothetical protein
VLSQDHSCREAFARLIAFERWLDIAHCELVRRVLIEVKPT